MKTILTITLTVLLFSFSFGQTITELHENRDFQEVIKFEKKANKLTPEELFMIGFAFFQLENDDKAIEFYDKAIAKGLDNGSVYFYKGLSYCYQGKYDEAMTEIELALDKEPSNQEFMNQKGLIYKNQGQEDKALEVFEEAIKLPNTYGEPYFWIAHIVHGKLDFEKALSLYYRAADSIPESNSYYLTTLQSIGQLEYTFTHDYTKSAKAYSQVIILNPTDYEYYPKLIKAYNAAKEYAKADSIFNLMKTAYYNKVLSEDDMEYKNAAVDESEWNGQKITVHKYFEDPKESIDLSYKVYLLNKVGDKVERIFMVEKTIQFSEDSPKHLLCEKDKTTGDHITYPYGWTTDDITLEELKKAVILVLDGKLTKGASTSFNGK
ncbi:MAG: tetratricopeptide repeat protein [Fluviicola sp.]|nr:tetratricopeptide repeat protein [Fluviicola sp.]